MTRELFELKLKDIIKNTKGIKINYYGMPFKFTQPIYITKYEFKENTNGEIVLILDLSLSNLLNYFFLEIKPWVNPLTFEETLINESENSGYIQTLNINGVGFNSEFGTTVFIKPFKSEHWCSTNTDILINHLLNKKYMDCLITLSNLNLRENMQDDNPESLNATWITEKKHGFDSLKITIKDGIVTEIEKII